MATLEELQAEIAELRQSLYNATHGRVGARGIYIGDKRLLADANHLYQEDSDGTKSRLDDVTSEETPKAHTIASHNDTTATGTELETLTDGSDADALHDHAQFASAAEAISAVEGEDPLDLAGVLNLTEMSTPSNPAINIASIFARASGSDIKLIVRSSTGAEAVLCTLADTVHVNVLTINWIE